MRDKIVHPYIPKSANGGYGPFPERLALNASDLNVIISNYPRVKSALVEHGISAIQVIFRSPTTVIIRATILYNSRQENLQVTGVLIPSTSTFLRFMPSDAQIGRFPVPSKDIDLHVDKLTKLCADQIHGILPVTVKQISINPTQLVLNCMAERGDF